MVEWVGVPDTHHRSREQLNRAWQHAAQGIRLPLSSPAKRPGIERPAIMPAKEATRFLPPTNAMLVLFHHSMTQPWPTYKLKVTTTSEALGEAMKAVKNHKLPQMTKLVCCSNKPDYSGDEWSLINGAWKVEEQSHRVLSLYLEDR